MEKENHWFYCTPCAWFFPFYLLKKSGISAEGTNRTKLNPELKSSRQWIRDFQEYIQLEETMVSDVRFFHFITGGRWHSHSPVTLLYWRARTVRWLEAVKTSPEQSDRFLWPHYQAGQIGKGGQRKTRSSEERNGPAACIHLIYDHAYFESRPCNTATLSSQ